ncbi:hypothetical protein GE061_006511 [Apolygus lucorum]|uniref:EGF-like domain-containing protein n=1 Tax=Apolygus lucorum TaxID=248454 RepID=A0A8S9WVS8_APOLU|nr:hypothetical protein GE061_006511 [Apolygus lucorum]
MFLLILQVVNQLHAGPYASHLKGLRDNSTDACEEHDPCQHGGICISTDSGPICECRNLDYEGIFCEKALFSGIVDFALAGLLCAGYPIADFCR